MKNNIDISEDNVTCNSTSEPPVSSFQAFSEDQAVEAARHCLLSTACNDCDLCRYFCPDLCITKNEKTGLIEIDYDYCKGCGICAYICPKKAISMIRELQADKSP